MNVWLVGGDHVIPTSVENAMKVDYTVTRISGEDRYETAAKVAEAGIKLNSGKKPSKVFLASGTSFADALAVSPVAFAKGYPIILTEKDSTSDFSKKELGAIGADTKILVGGTSVVSDKVKGDLGASTRVAGDDRAITANLVSDWAKASEGFTKTQAALVGGTNGNGADSLVASSVLGKSLTTLHFAGWDATNVYLKDHAAELTGKGVVFGGKAAVSEDQVSKAQAAAQTVVSNQSFKVAADGASTVELDNKGEGSVKYTVSGLESDNVAIALFAPSSLKIDSDGVNFVDANGDLVADRTEPTSASVSVVNGVSQSAGQTAIFNVKPSNGTITFTVAASATTQAIPVVYANPKNATSFDLKVDAKAVPTAKFGIGAQAGFVPGEAVFGAHAPAVAAGAVNSQDWYFVGTEAVGGKDVGATYYYDTNDTFKYQGVGISGEQFVSILQGGGTVKVAYAPTKEGVSSFDIQTATVPSVSSVKATVTGDKGTDVKLTWTAPEKATGVTYSVWRSGDAALEFDKDTRVAKDLTSAGYTDAAVEDGDHYYFVVTSNTANGAMDAGVGTGKVVTPLKADSTKPTSLETVIEDKGFAGVLDTGDIISLGASEAVKLGSNPGLVVSDKDKNVVTLDSSNATFSLDGQAIKVTLTKTPTFGTSASNIALTDSAVTNSRDVMDAAGNAFDTTGALLVAAPTGAKNDPKVAGKNDETKFTATFDFAVDASTVTAADFTVPSGNSVTGVSVDDTGKIVTVTVAKKLATDESIGVKAKSISDAARTLTGPSVAISAKVVA